MIAGVRRLASRLAQLAATTTTVTRAFRASLMDRIIVLVVSSLRSCVKIVRLGSSKRSIAPKTQIEHASLVLVTFIAQHCFPNTHAVRVMRAHMRRVTAPARKIECALLAL